MKKNLGSLPALFPMPVVVVAAYDENGMPNAMTAAWAMITDMDKIALFVDPEHKTMKNILATKAFTVALADLAHMAEADFLGIISGNQTPDKFIKSGLHESKSEFVNAPVITELPVNLDCELVDVIEVTGLGGEGGGNVGMPLSITYGGTRTVGTATRNAETGVVTFTAS